jgi:hypothetical protein
MTTKTAKRATLANVEVTGEGFDDLGHRYLKIKVTGSNRDLRPYSMTDIAKREQLYCDLGDAGCNLFSHQAQRDLQNLLQGHVQQEPSFSVATRLGSFGNFYVRPDEIIGNSPLAIELSLGFLDFHMLQKYRCRGSLEGWQEKIGKLCAGNSRLMFAASLACTGPILAFVAGPRTGGFQIYGKAESGKTAAAMVAGSVWGCHRDTMRKDKGFAESWNTTINKLEETARAHSDALLVIDETNLAGANPKERVANVLNGAFRLSESVQKGRLNESKRAAWRFYFLSTSNLCLDEMADHGGISIDDQHHGRLVDIVLPPGSDTFGIYQDLHGFSDGATLTDAIKSRCRSVFGTPGDQLVRRIYRNKQSRSATKTFVKARRQFYISLARKRTLAKRLKPLERATARFATVYAAGCLAIKHGIFNWSRRDLLRAILSCQLDSLDQAPGKTDLVGNLRQRLIEYLVQNRRHFVSLEGKRLAVGNHEFGSVPGYIQTHNGVDWLYLTSDQLRAVIGTGNAARQLRKELVDEGILAGKRGLVQRPIFKAKGNKGYHWVHAIRVSLLKHD